MNAVAHRVTDFVWRGDARGGGDLFAAPLADAARDLGGQFALHQHRAGAHRLARDPLGVNKLFWTVANGDVVSANFLIDLVRAGHAVRDVWSAPSGHVLEIRPDERRLELHAYAPLAFARDCAGARGDVVDGVRTALRDTFARLRPVVAGRPLYVTMSGGLDSTVVAVLARECLGPFTGITFALEPGDSDDLEHARRVADRLGVRLEVVTASRDQVLEQLDEVLLYGQDWRDFNVHCGLVNAALARRVQELHRDNTSSPPVVLTGDGMNELMADYTSVPYGGHDYYRLPRLEAGRLRAHLVAGLDAGDREVGIFANRGIDLLQPYAQCAGAYAAIPDAWISEPGAKQSFVQSVMADAVPPAVYARPKVRAQVGSEARVGGTLAVLADAGFDARRLADRFAALFGIAATGDLIRAGRYRYPVAYVERKSP